MRGEDGTRGAEKDCPSLRETSGSPLDSHLHKSKGDFGSVRANSASTGSDCCSVGDSLLICPNQIVGM